MRSTVDDLLELHQMVASGRARELRESAGLSASALARDLDVTTGALTRWEQGLRFPQRANARRYAKILRRLAAQQQAAAGELAS
jgi:transcriptional regulator with XRE-family HTH domain